MRGTPSVALAVAVVVCQLRVVAGGQAGAIDDDEVTKWDTKGGFIPGTKDDVETGWMTVDKAKDRCARLSECLAVTFRGAAEVTEPVFAYLKRDTTVAEADKTWTSMIKRPAGLMDVNFINQLAFPLELCWIDLVGTAAPICYGTVQPSSSKNMSSFAGHNFVLKRLVWSLIATSAARGLAGASGVGGAAEESRSGDGALPITARQRAHEWEAPLFLSAASASEPSAHPLEPVKLVNKLTQPAEVCSAPRWASRLLQASMPVGLETCHGVVAVGGTLSISGLSSDTILLARQLVGVTTIQKRVDNYMLQQQQLSAGVMKKMVSAMSGGGSGSPTLPTPARPPAKPPSKPQASSLATNTWIPYLAIEEDTAVSGGLRARCDAQVQPPPSSSSAVHTPTVAEMAAAAKQLMPRMVTLLTTPPAATSSPSDNAGEGCEGVCAAVAAASGLEPAALDPAAWRTLEWLRQQAPQLAASVGPAPLTVLAAAPLEAAGEAGARRGSEGGGGSNAVAGIGEVVGLNPLHVALALAFGGARRLSILLVSSATSSAAASAAQQLLEVWTCAAGIDLSVRELPVPSAGVRMAVGEAGGQQIMGAPSDSRAADPGGQRAHLVIAGSSRHFWWEVASLHSMALALILALTLTLALILTLTLTLTLT